MKPKLKLVNNEVQEEIDAQPSRFWIFNDWDKAHLLAKGWEKGAKAQLRADKGALKAVK